MASKWVKILARNAPLLVWVTEANALKTGIRMGGFVWKRSKDLDIKFNAPLVAVFDYKGKSEDSNLKKFISKKNNKIEKIISKIENDINDSISLRPGKTNKDCVFLYKKFRTNMTYMLAGYYISQNIYNEIKSIINAKSFGKIESHIIQPYKKTLGIREHQAIEILKIKYRKKLINKRYLRLAAKRLAKQYGFFHSEYQTDEWEEDDYFREISSTYGLKDKAKSKGEYYFSDITDEYILWLINIAQKWTYIYDEAKASQTRALWALRKTITKLGFDEKEIFAATDSELLSWSKGEKLPLNILDRQHFFSVMLWNDKIKVTFGEKEVSDVIKKERIREFSNTKNTRNLSEIKGKVGFNGLVRGKAHIVFNQQDADKIKKGEILIASMTTAELIRGMRNATAFITDEGGIISHAAIVAREMKKPCIIGTKIATKVIKSGDFLEVDANKGIVKILKKA